jgi:hypothetical protein
MDSEIETKHTTAVEEAVQSIYKTTFPGGSLTFIPEAFRWATDCFTGNYHDYQAIDARYHDFEHTLQGTLCLARLLHGYWLAGAEPMLTQRMFELGMMAILFHDTGYLKREDDHDGTGAKYTLIHVSRSVAFAGALLEEKGFAPEEIKSVQNMIRCTGVNVNLQTIPFQEEWEQKVGFALGTADLLGQMAAKDYVDKLPILYSEFEESARYNAGRGTTSGLFKNARDLMEKTPLFWEKYVVAKINGDFQGMYKYLNVPYPNGENIYLKRINANMEKLRKVLTSGRI